MAGFNAVVGIFFVENRAESVCLLHGAIIAFVNALVVFAVVDDRGCRRVDAERVDRCSVGEQGGDVFQTLDG
jgi:hypothetical protein